MAQKDIKVNFPIPVSEKGRIKANDAKKLLKYLAAEHLLKVGMDYFVTDSTGHEEMWTFQKSMDWEHDYEFSCEVFDDDRDFYNCLYFDKKSGKIDYKSCEYEAHLVECAKKEEKMNEFVDANGDEYTADDVFNFLNEDHDVTPEWRIEGLMDEFGMTKDEAEKWLAEWDKEINKPEEGMNESVEDMYKDWVEESAPNYDVSNYDAYKAGAKLAEMPEEDISNSYENWLEQHEPNYDVSNYDAFEAGYNFEGFDADTYEKYVRLCQHDEAESYSEEEWRRMTGITKEMEESTSNKVEKMTESFNGAKFERHIPSNMRYKYYEVVDGDLYWVTQEPFDEMDEMDFAKALGLYTPYAYAYVICRDASRGYEADMNSPYIHEIAADDDDDIEELTEAEEPKSYIIRAEGPYFDYSENPYYHAGRQAFDATKEEATRFDKQKLEEFMSWFEDGEFTPVADDREPNWSEFMPTDYSVFTFNSYEEFRDFENWCGFNDYNTGNHAVDEFEAETLEDALAQAESGEGINILCIEHKYNDYEPIKCQINGGEWMDWKDVDPEGDFPAEYDADEEEEEEEFEESVTLEVFDVEGHMIDRQPGFKNSNEAKAFVDENEDQYPADYKINIKYNESEEDDEFERYYHPTEYEEPVDFDWRGDEIKAPEYNIDDEWLEEAPELEYEPVEDDLTDLFARNEVAEEIEAEEFEEKQKLHDSIKLKESSKKYFEKLGVRK